MMKGNFIDNLPKVYGIYTGGFLAFIISSLEIYQFQIKKMQE